MGLLQAGLRQIDPVFADQSDQPSQGGGQQGNGGILGDVGQRLANSVIGRYRRNHPSATPPAPPSPSGVPQITGNASTDSDDFGASGDMDSMARGGFAPRPMTARVAESGPELAGGKIITNPSIVKLDKGDSVIPLTPRPENKLQPDLIEGHVAPPRVPGMQFSRYKSYGQGRGLMR